MERSRIATQAGVHELLDDTVRHKLDARGARCVDMIEAGRGRDKRMGLRRAERKALVRRWIQRWQ